MRHTGTNAALNFDRAVLAANDAKERTKATAARLGVSEWAVARARSRLGISKGYAPRKTARESVPPDMLAKKLAKPLGNRCDVCHLLLPHFGCIVGNATKGLGGNQG